MESVNYVDWLIMFSKALQFGAVTMACGLKNH